MLLACLTLLGVERAGAQTQAATALSVTVPAALRLQLVSTGGTAELTGSFTEVRAAVVLRVNANCPWRLVPVVASEGSAVQVRVEVAGSPTAVFQPLAGTAAIAAGGRGRDIEVVVDYRLPTGVAAPAVGYKLQVAGG